ncbi:MAG: S-layer homology domain-containing protein [Candidatus Gastranaerophilales bacterium]|nr:S-layer homology domain-containing protein [Candidatus Gastranaerophilales bacterium]
MKKIFNLFLALFLFGTLVFVPGANAADIADIGSDYWAHAEINQMIDNGIMTVDSNNNFNPNAPVERAAFTSMLIKVLNQSSLDVYIENPFEDVDVKTEFYDDIMRSEQIGLIYGYPDGTFRPKTDIVKSEVTSVVSHITKDTIYDLSILDDFTDTDKIPEWAKAAYAKTVKYNLFVNYPDRAQFEPDRDITRAETAVLLAKLQNAISNVKEEYKAEEVEKTLSTEHLSIHSQAASNLVTITNMKKVIEEGNILKVSFTDKYKAKDANVGDSVVLVNEKDVITDEGTLLIPANSKFYATVEDIVQPKILNKSGAIKFNFNKLELAGGQSTTMDGTVYNDLEGYLKKSSAKKLLGYTVGGAVLGVGVGSAIGFPVDEVGTAYAIGIPSGAVLGFLTGLFTKGSMYTANKGDELYIKLNAPLYLQESL